MILRRVIAHVREQDWTAIAIDFVIVVIGVFVGIQVANWNEAQQARGREREFVSRLRLDFELIEARLAQNITRWNTRVESPQRILGDLAAFRRDGAWPRPKAEMLSDLHQVFDGRIPAPRAATYVELVSTGQLGLLRSTRLREALLAYDMQVGYTQTAYEVLVRRTDPHIASLVAHLEINSEIDPDAEPPDATEEARVWTDVDLQGLANDAAAVVALKMHARASLNQLMVSRAQQQKAASVLSVLGPDAGGAEGPPP